MLRLDNPIAKLWNGKAITAGQTYKTDPVPLPFAHLGSFTVVLAGGGVAGTATIEVSNGTEDEIKRGIADDWQTYGGTAAVVMPSAGTGGLSTSDCDYAWARLSLVCSGSGTATVRSCVKQKGVA